MKVWMISKDTMVDPSGDGQYPSRVIPPVIRHLVELLGRESIYLEAVKQSLGLKW